MAYPRVEQVTALWLDRELREEDVRLLPRLLRTALLVTAHRGRGYSGAAIVRATAGGQVWVAVIERGALVTELQAAELLGVHQTTVNDAVRRGWWIVGGQPYAVTPQWPEGTGSMIALSEVRAIHEARMRSRRSPGRASGRA